MDILNKSNNDVAKEIKDMMSFLTNENVKGNADMQLDVWCRIFSRLLKVDGMQMLCSHSELRFNVKQRAHEALNYHDHPIIDTATKINTFLEQVEYWGFGLDDIRDEEQL